MMTFCKYSCKYYFCSFHVASDTVFVICYSLIMLSVDLISPHVKNKMSSAGFISG